jgi:hypothetical protein
MLELAPVHHHWRRHREAVVLARMVDVTVAVEDRGDVANREALSGERVLELLFLVHPAGHAQPLHDLGVTRSRVDEDGARRVAEDQDAPGVDPDRRTHVPREHEEARLDENVDQREQADLVRHGGLDTP